MSDSSKKLLRQIERVCDELGCDPEQLCLSLLQMYIDPKPGESHVHTSLLGFEFTLTNTGTMQ